MRIPIFCICQSKGADQLGGNYTADQLLCFRYIDSMITLLLKSKISSRGCTAQFVSDLVENHVDRFSHDTAQLWFIEKYGVISLDKTPVTQLRRWGHGLFMTKILTITQRLVAKDGQRLE